MPTYRNGYIPRELLLVFASGVNTAVGYWEHSLPPATYGRHLALVERARNRTGRKLAMGSGWSAYRPYDQQVKARHIYGNGAAVPGTSSHGGFWEGRQTLAMDYSHWSWVYQGHGGRDAFAADCRAVGLTPNLIVPARGYPDEPWHVVDLDPWSAVPAFDNSHPFNLEEDMSPEQFAVLSHVSAKLTDLLNEINTPGTGLEDRLLHTMNMVSDARNDLHDPDHGLLAMVSGLKAGAGQADVGGLADLLKAELPEDIAAELGKRLANG